MTTIHFTILRKARSHTSLALGNGNSHSKGTRPSGLNGDHYLELEIDPEDKSLNTWKKMKASVAYASVSPASSFWSKLMFYFRSNSQAVLASLTFVGVVIVLSSDYLHPHSGGPKSISLRSKLRGGNAVHFGGAFYPGYFSVEDSIMDKDTFRFAAVSDLDQLSHVTDQSKPTFRSLLLPGILKRDPTTSMYSAEFHPVRTLISQHNEAGRGMELSELTMYQNRLLTFDDRTGTVFEILSKNGGAESMVVPRFVITEGMGDTDKGMKWEWATTKGNELYMGSMGKEYTHPDGSVANTNNLWIVVINSDGQIRRIDWTDKYNFVREKLGASAPGYIINEAILWSEHLKSWLFLPRRISSEMYDENADEKKGSNKLAIVDEHFKKVSIVDINFQTHDPLRGFSTFAFVPGTRDRHALAIRSVEEDCVGGLENVCKQRSYMSVFDVLTGDVLMHEVELASGEEAKFEGVEFVNVYTKEPRKEIQ